MPVTITGSNTPTAGGVTYGDGTTYANTAAGSSGQVLLSNGASAPTWGTAGTSTTATNLAGGVAGAVPYQSGAGATSFSAAGSSGQVLTSAGTSVPTWTSQSSLTAGTATNLAGGSNGTIPYQSASGTTQMLAVGSSGQVLQTNGAGAPTWVTPSGGLTFISTTTTSGVTFLNITSGFSTTYDEYLMFIEATYATEDTMTMQYYIDGSLNSTSANYESNIVYSTATGGTGSVANQAGSYAVNYISVYGFRINTTVNLFNTHTSGKVKSTSTSFGGKTTSPYTYGGAGGGNYTGAFTTGVTGIRIGNDAGTTFSSLKVKLYGYQKS